MIIRPHLLVSTILTSKPFDSGKIGSGKERLKISTRVWAAARILIQSYQRQWDRSMVSFWTSVKNLCIINYKCSRKSFHLFIQMFVHEFHYSSFKFHLKTQIQAAYNKPRGQLTPPVHGCRKRKPCIGHRTTPRLKATNVELWSLVDPGILQSERHNCNHPVVDHS